MKKRAILGHLVILSAGVVGVLGTFLLDYLQQFTKHPERLEIIFGIAGGLIGFASFMLAFGLYTNNMGDGFDKKD